MTPSGADRMPDLPGQGLDWRNRFTGNSSETSRLAALHRLRVLDTPADAELDRIARLAARLLRTPIGLVSLVDENRQWFKSHYGLDIQETSRELSFCSHALESDHVFLVRDATQDERFAANALVTGKPDIRFYAGAPLATEGGFRVGTLSVIDRVARHDVTQDDLATLRHLAALVVDHLELRLARMVAEEHVAKMARLSQIAGLVVGAQSVHEALTALARELKSLVGARRVIVMLSVSRHHANEPLVDNQIASDAGTTSITPLERRLAGDAIQQRKASVWTGQDTAVQKAEEGTEAARAGIAVFPLLSQSGKSLGAVLVSPEANGRFAKEDETLLSQFAQLASAHIENLLLLEHTKAAEARFRRVVESGMMGIIFWNASGEITEANDAYLSMIGYTRDELNAGLVRWTELTPPEFAELDRKGLEQIRQTGICKPFEKEYIRRDGHRVPVIVGGAALSEKDAVTGVAFVLDISERKRAEEAGRESERISRAIIETALDAFIQMDEAGVIVEWNRRAEQLFGWSREEAIGRPLSEVIVPAKYRQLHEGGLANFKRTGEGKILGRRLEIEALRRDGSLFQSELAVTALQTRSGYLFNGFVRDISEKLATEAQLRQAQKMEAVGQLTGGIAHDFNNILTVIVGNLDVARDDPTIGVNSKEIIESALDAALRGGDLVRRLLAFARRQPLQPEVASVNEIIRVTTGLLQRVIDPRISIQLSLSDGVWPVKVDRGQLEAAIMNLLTNARDAMPDGGCISITSRNLPSHAVARLAAGAKLRGDHVLVAVSDTGRGMPPDVAEHIFEPFFTTKGPGKGTGLGLSMVYGFISQSDGHIEVRSEVGIGTTFEIYLPRVSHGAARADVSKPVPVRTEGRTVLVVDDDRNVRKTLIQQLRALGFTTIEAEDAKAAMDILESGATVDLLLTDVVMPGTMDGVDLARAALHTWPDLRILLSSGFPDVRTKRSISLGPQVRFLAKPYRKADLANALAEVLEG